MKERISFKVAMKNSKYKKKYIAEQLGVAQTSLSRIIKNPSTLLNSKLKLNKILELLELSADEIDFS